MSNDLLSKYVIPGNKVDIRAIRWKKGEEENEREIYQSQVYDILSDDRIAIVMPMEKSKLILLPTGKEYDLFFYSPNGLYQCKAKIADREKKNNTYLLIMDLLSNLRKDQRREFYRFSCAVEMKSRVLRNEEIRLLEEKGMDEELMVPDLPLKRSVVVDISGGGLRFVSDYAYEEGSVLLCTYQLDTAEGTKVYEVSGRVLSIKEVENRPGVFEHRVQYLKIDNEVREQIIKYIFEEERKNLKNKD